MPSLGEYLLQAYQQQVTGRLSVFVGGRRSELFLQNGELAGARIRTGYQNPAQALLTRGIVTPAQLDAWWARGAVDVPDADALDVTRGFDAELFQFAANIRSLAMAAEDVQFDWGADGVSGRRHSLLPLLRVAFESEPRPADRSYRLVDIERARPWLLEGEESWLSSSYSTFQLADFTTVGILELLVQVGAVEAAAADFSGIPAGALPEENPPVEAVAGESLYAADPTPPAAPRRGLPEQPLPTSSGEAVVFGANEGEAMAAAQSTLLRDMEEALRRAGAAPGAGSPGATEAASELETIELTSEMVGAEPPSPYPALPNQPVVFGPGATEPARLDNDLWRVAQFGSAGTDDGSSSFEQALQRFDAGLEDTSGSFPAPESALPVEAEIETIEPKTEEVPLDDLFHQDIWPFDDEELATDPMDPADEARARRQRLLRRAMENMGTLQPPRRPEGAEVVQPAPAPDAAVGSATPPDSDQDKQFAESIEQRFAALQIKKEYFAILGLSKQATKDQVKAAFLSLAKVFHPDRLPPSLQALVPKISAVFESIREAYDQLYEDAKRQEYLQKLASSERANAKAPAAIDAANAFKQAEQLFKKKDFVAAEQLYDAALALERKAVYLAGKAWCWYMDPGRRGDGSKAKQLLNEAIRIDRQCDRALYQLGVIARVEGDVERAERCFRDAVGANPKHFEARQELRLIEMRRKKSR